MVERGPAWWQQFVGKPSETPHPSGSGYAADSESALDPTIQVQRDQAIHDEMIAHPKEPTETDEEFEKRLAEAGRKKMEEVLQMTGGFGLSTPEALQGVGKTVTPENVVDFVAYTTAERWRQRRLEEKYGTGRLARLRQFLDGETEIAIDDAGNIAQVSGGMTRAGRFLTRIFTDKRVLLGAGGAAVSTVLTGGLSLPAFLAVAGTAAGRGLAEFATRKREQGFRGEEAKAYFEELKQLKDEAKEAQDPTVSDDERAAAVKSVIEKVYQKSSVVDRLAPKEQELNKRNEKIRGWFTALGSIAGLGTGLAINYQAFMVAARQGGVAMDLDANGIKHKVIEKAGKWMYLLTQSEASQYLEHPSKYVVEQIGAHGAKSLFESPAQIIFQGMGGLQEAARIGATTGGQLVGQFIEYRKAKQAAPTTIDAQARLDTQRQTLGQEAQKAVQATKSPDQIKKKLEDLAKAKEVRLPFFDATNSDKWSFDNVIDQYKRATGRDKFIETVDGVRHLLEHGIYEVIDLDMNHGIVEVESPGHVRLKFYQHDLVENGKPVLTLAEKTTFDEAKVLDLYKDKLAKAQAGKYVKFATAANLASIGLDPAARYRVLGKIEVDPTSGHHFIRLENQNTGARETRRLTQPLSTGGELIGAMLDFTDRP